MKDTSFKAARAEHESKIAELQAAKENGYRYYSYSIKDDTFNFYVCEQTYHTTPIEEGLKKQWA